MSLIATFTILYTLLRYHMLWEDDFYPVAENIQLYHSKAYL